MSEGMHTDGLLTQPHSGRVHQTKKNVKGDITKMPRVMAKLLEEAERVKVVLSVNSVTTAKVCGDLW